MGRQPAQAARRVRAAHALQQLRTNNPRRAVAGKRGIGQAAACRRPWEILRMLDARGMLPAAGTVAG